MPVLPVRPPPAPRLVADERRIQRRTERSAATKGTAAWHRSEASLHVQSSDDLRELRPPELGGRVGNTTAPKKGDEKLEPGYGRSLLTEARWTLGEKRQSTPL